MNLLFEIADRDIMFILFIIFGILLFIFIIIYVIGKGNNVSSITEEKNYDKDIKEPELFTHIKPVTEEQQEAKDELERVFRQMSTDLETKNKAPKVIEKFEQEQEENAVISYQELIKQAEMKRETETLEIKDIEKPAKEEIETIDEPKKFKNSDIISPIFGIQNPSDNSYSKEKPTEELEVAYENNSNIEFLNSLKDLRKNL